MLNDKKIPNLALKFKSNNILPLLAQKLWKFEIIPRYSLFWQVLCQMGIKCCSIWLLRPDLESSHNLASIRIQFVISFPFLIFGLPCLYFDHKCRLSPIFGKCKFRRAQNYNKRFKNASDRGWDRAFSKSCTKRTTLIYSPPFPPLLTYGPST